MHYYRANYSSRGQLKIQEMAFVLVALLVFFALVSLFYFSVRLSNLKENAVLQRADEAQQLIRKIAATPEFSWDSCSSAICIDLDKALLLKERQAYKNFWNLEHLSIVVLYPAEQGECTRFNYPNCGTITLVNKSAAYGSDIGAFVSLCRQELSDGESYSKCVIGKVYAAGRSITHE